MLHNAYIGHMTAMANEPKRSAKTEVLSMRMDPKTRFLVDILARSRGQSISTVVERAILEAADNAVLGGHGDTKTWRHYWHLSEGVRTLNMAVEQSLYPTYEDECRLDFARTHWPFFYMAPDCKRPKSWNVDVLWPAIDHYLDMWEASKSNDYFKTGKAMQQALKNAGLLVPDWPQKIAEKPPEKPAEKPATTSSGRGGSPDWNAPKGGDLDDEIPF